MQPFLQKRAALVMEAAPRQVDGLDLARCRSAYGLVVAFADQEVILDDAPERRKRKPDGAASLLRAVADVEHEPALGNRQCQPIRPRGFAFHAEEILAQ